MTAQEFENLLNKMERTKSESSTLEIKAAYEGCPRRLYDSLSSFSNQDDGGIILFGVDEAQGFQLVGVYDGQELQKRVAEQCLEMEPPVRPLFTVFEKQGKTLVTAEIPGMDITQRPCYYKGKGRVKGSFLRVGDADEPMTEYEVYSYEAFRKKYQDDVQVVPRATLAAINQVALKRYLELLKNNKPNLAQLSETAIYELMSITRETVPTIATVLLFSPYPQVYFPQLCITAVSLPGETVGNLGTAGERFLDNKRIEGTVAQMLEEALAFIRNNIRIKTIIDPDTGKRADRGEYPLSAIREVLLNALVHRDYSINTQGMPIQIILFQDHLEIKSPGGLYGRMKMDQLGKVQADTRNPVLATALETLGITENRYSGIPTIRREMELAKLPEPTFADERGTFVVRLYKRKEGQMEFASMENVDEKDILLYCITPRTRREVANYLGLSSQSYAIQTYVMPLVKQGRIRLSIPEKPGSAKQLFITADSSERIFSFVK